MIDRYSRRVGWGILGLSLLATAPSGAETLEPEDAAVVDRVREAYRAVRSLEASFQQRNDWDLMESETTYLGMLYVRDDGRVRVEYRVPEGHLFVSDGTSLWTYVPESGQVVKQSSESRGRAVHQLFLDFLAGGRVLEVTRGEERTEIVLEPHESLGLSRLVVEVDNRTGFGKTFSWTDHEGNTASYELLELAVNAEMDSTLFEFSPPSGVEVVELDEFGR